MTSWMPEEMVVIVMGDEWDSLGEWGGWLLDQDDYRVDNDEGVLANWGEGDAMAITVSANNYWQMSDCESDHCRD